MWLQPSVLDTSVSENIMAKSSFSRETISNRTSWYLNAFNLLILDQIEKICSESGTEYIYALIAITIKR